MMLLNRLSKYATPSFLVLLTIGFASCAGDDTPKAPKLDQYVTLEFSREFRYALFIPSGGRKSFELGRAPERGVLYWGAGVTDRGTARPRFRGYVGDELFAETAFDDVGAWIDERIPIPAGGAPGRPIRVEVEAGDAHVYLSDVGIVDLDATQLRPNVLVLMVDTLRRDHVQVYGYDRNTTSKVAALAEDGFVFEQATSSSSWTKTAIASLLTGYRPDRHRVMGHVDRFPDDLPTLPALLKENGYHTIGVSANANIAQHSGYARGFDRFTQFSKFDGDRRVMEAALEDIRFAEGRPWLAYVHFMGPHSPYSPPDDLWHRFQDPEPAIERETIYRILQETSNELMGFGARLLLQEGTHNDHSCEDCPDIQERISEDALVQLIEDVYDAEIFNTDRVIGELLDALRENGAYENTLVVFVSDHGEELWDHGLFHHGHALHDELIRVPLIIKPPGQTPSDTRIDSVAQIVDLAPTIADFTGVPMTWEGNGISLRPAMEGQRPPNRLAIAQLDRPVGFKVYVAPEKITLRVVRDATRKLFHDQTNDRWTYFDLAADPLEQRPVMEIPASASDMRKAIERMPILYRPGLNVLIAMPRDRAAEIACTLTGNGLPEPRFDTMLPETAVEAVDGGWRISVSTDPASGHATTSSYFNPIAWIPMTIEDEVAVSVTMNGDPLPSERIVIHGMRTDLGADGKLNLETIRARTTPYRGAAVKSAPRLFIWYRGVDDETDDQDLDSELKEELKTLGYL